MRDQRSRSFCWRFYISFCRHDDDHVIVESYYIWTVHQPSHGKRVKKTSALTALVLGCALIGAVLSAVVLSTRSVLGGDGLSTHYGSTGLAEYAVRLSDCIACH